MPNAKEPAVPDTGNKLNRRELLSKYGSYTAPVVAAMLMPGQAAANGGPYSNLDACIAGHGGAGGMGMGMGMVNMMVAGHCTMNGMGGHGLTV